MSMPALDPEETPPAAAELAPSVDAPTLLAVPLSTPELVTGEEPVSTESPGVEQKEPTPAGWALIALVPFEGREPPAQVSDCACTGGLVHRHKSLASRPALRRR